MVDSAADADLPDCESDYSANLVKSTEEGQRELKPSRHVTSNIRLMNATTHTLREFVGTMVPEYAILSHTWLPDGEVLFEDMADLRIASRKPGFKKIELTCKQALCDGLDWVWVDTCCIDKKSSAELSEAINSMFDWYRCSTLCYAYLSDIEGDAGISESRWFTRGWTLQELIAPNNLMFYSRKWRKLGSRYDRAEEVSSRTKIGVEFLNREGPGINPADVRQNLKKASVAYKMSWASDRTTTRIEDNAYSLLGIFQVNMPLLYGEGNRAFGRLQEEIMRISDDQSMLAWGRVFHFNDDFTFGLYAPDSGEFSRPAFASDPSEFRDSGNIVPDELSTVKAPSILTNRGVQVDLLISEPAREVWAVLACRSRFALHKLATIPLHYIGPGLYGRARPIVRFIHRNDLQACKLRTVFISRDASFRRVRSFFNSEIRGAVFRTLPPSLSIEAVEPKHLWDEDLRSFILPENGHNIFAIDQSLFLNPQKNSQHPLTGSMNGTPDSCSSFTVHFINNDNTKITLQIGVSPSEWVQLYSGSDPDPTLRRLHRRRLRQESAGFRVSMGDHIDVQTPTATFRMIPIDVIDLNTETEDGLAG